MNFETIEKAIEHIRKEYNFVFVRINEKTRVDRENSFSLKKELPETTPFTSTPCKWSRVEEVKSWTDNDLYRFFLSICNDGSICFRSSRMFR
jgi:hypothetical protein